MKYIDLSSTLLMEHYLYDLFLLLGRAVVLQADGGKIRVRDGRPSETMCHERLRQS